MTLHCHLAVDLSQYSLPLHRSPSSWPAQSPSVVQVQVFTPDSHLLSAHLSFWVQPLPSSQARPLLLWTQPSLASQLSVVQGLPSSHSTVAVAGVPLQPLAAHTSPWLHALPSSHGRLLAPWTQPVLGEQLSVVHRLPSSHTTDTPAQLPVLHESFWVQPLPSSHGLTLNLKAHLPLAISQLSSVQGLLSSHPLGLPGRQSPLEHKSPIVQGLSSSQPVPGRLAWMHPLAAPQPSKVQGFLSSQSKPLPLTHAPWLQTSPVVQALPSSQTLVLSTWLQPTAGSQLSVVQTLLSSQGAPENVQVLATHSVEPPGVHALPSSQAWPSTTSSSTHSLPAQNAATQGLFESTGALQSASVAHGMGGRHKPSLQTKPSTTAKASPPEPSLSVASPLRAQMSSVQVSPSGKPLASASSPSC